MKAQEFKQYKRKGLSEMIPFKEFVGQDMSTISVSDQDKLLSNEEFELGYIARNPKNHADMWYVAKKYFDDNLELSDTPEVDADSIMIDSLKELYVDFHNANRLTKQEITTIDNFIKFIMDEGSH
jgi:hypothetical protein